MSALSKIRSMFNREPAIVFYSTYEDAAKNCTTYLDGDIAELVVKKTKQFCKESVTKPDRQFSQNYFVLSESLKICGQERISIVDWGGAAGFSYFQISPFFQKQLKQWLVLETPVMVQTANHLENDCLKFSSSKDAILRNPDFRPSLIWAQGVLNFIPNPLDQLRAFLDQAIPLIYISRTVTTPGDRNLIVRYEAPLYYHGPGTAANVKDKMTSYPLTIISKQQLHFLLKEKNYRILFTFDEGTQSFGSTSYFVEGLLLTRL